MGAGLGLIDTKKRRSEIKRESLKNLYFFGDLFFVVEIKG